MIDLMFSAVFLSYAASSKISPRHTTSNMKIHACRSLCVIYIHYGEERGTSCWMLVNAKKYNLFLVHPQRTLEHGILGRLRELSIIEACHFLANLDEYGFDTRMSTPVGQDGQL